MRYKYKRYLPTDQFWLPNMPAHWHFYKMKRLFSERIEKGYPAETLLVSSQNMGVIPQKIYGLRTVKATKGLELLKRVHVGDFVISLRSFQGGIEFAHYQGIISPSYTVLTPTVEISPDYFRYLAKSKLFIGLLQTCVTGIREGQNISYKKLRNYKLPVPPRDEQDQIVRFLDWKVSRINKLINIKKEQIKELDSLRRSMISKIITHGLITHTSMKYSGIKWLGKVPTHWQITKLRQILHPVSEKNHPELPLLSVVREQGVILRDIEDKESNHNFIPNDLSDYKVVRKGQFAMNKMKAWQGSYGVSNYTGIVSPAYFIFDIAFDNLEYFHYAIRSNIYVNFFAQASDGIRIGQWDLQLDKMKEIPFVVPPEDEQIAIVEYIKKALPKYNILLQKLGKEVAILEELKNKLIADVVTGQIDVRNIEIPDYEDVEETVDDFGDDNEDADYDGQEGTNADNDEWADTEEL